MGFHRITLQPLTRYQAESPCVSSTVQRADSGIDDPLRLNRSAAQLSLTPKTVPTLWNAQRTLSAVLFS